MQRSGIRDYHSDSGAKRLHPGYRQVSKIDATAVLFPVAITGGIEAVATADLFRHRCRRDRFRGRNGGHGRLGNKGGFAYHLGIHNPRSLSPTPMPDNPQPGFALPGYRFIGLEGRDAQAFAHAQFMNDVKSLGSGIWQWNGWLTPKGRVIALFALLKFDDERFGLLLLDADPGAFAASLRRYVFRSKLVIDVRDDWQVCGSFSTPVQVAGDAIAGSPDTGIELDLSGNGGSRTLRIAANAGHSADADAAARWTAFDLEHGLPRLPSSQVEQWTPQMLSLERLRAFSVKKGCYPGQEIVARTHFLGQAKRGLALFEAATSVAVGSEVRDGERVLGTVVSAEGPLALAVLPLGHEANALRLDGSPLRERPLLGGLAR